MKKGSVFLLVFSSLFFLQFRFFTPTQPSGKWNENSKLSQVLEALGEPLPKHYPSAMSEEAVKQGEELVKNGKTTHNGTPSRFISKFYTCTSCHNLTQEDPDLRYSDPETRLPYVKSKGIAFLQGTTFYGMVNRESWYNGDYQKKYGDLALLAHDSLRESIQLCAKVCSQGRRLEKWELNAILCYVWTLEYTLGDLKLESSDYERINAATANEEKQAEMIALLKSRYTQRSPATFTDAPPDKKSGYEGLTGRPETGKDIYELSCQNCHHQNGESNLVLDNTSYTFRKFKRKIAKESRFSLYKIIRYGTHPIDGHRPYMPHYPLERMSNQQVEDLRAYIEQQAI